MASMPPSSRATYEWGIERPARLVRTRLVGYIGQPSLNVVTAPDGDVVALPGQGGVIRNVTLDDRAGGWISDHLEPGVSLIHPDPDANRALQILACVGNEATVLDGPSAGARGLVFGKHGAVLTMFDPRATAQLAPGERVVIDAEGVGSSIGDDDITVHSCDPRLLRGLITERDRGGLLTVPVVTVLPAQAAGAGQGMSAARFDLDILVADGTATGQHHGLRFGDVIAIADQDHRYTRAPRPGYVAIGSVCHGRSVGGGHGFGMVTLLSGPIGRFDLQRSAEARLDRIIPPPWVSQS